MQLQLRQRLAIARAFGEHLAPKPLRPVTIAALGGKGRQVAPGQVTVNPLIEAAKLVGTLQIEDPPPTPLGLGRLSAMPVHHRDAES
jgi:hypothetical protein